ncbi:MAG: hypothetical protein JKX72_08330 [Robiginitomaculum sp.]|nr:hypothetical protein [Robiginitomaculum sp.]
MGIVFVVIAMINLDLGFINIGFSLIPVTVIYLWPTRASYSWSLLFIFMLGIVNDMTSHGPLGIWSICYLLLFIIMEGGLNPKASFRNAILGFFLSLVFVVLLAYIIGYLSLGHPPRMMGFVGSIFVALLYFPVFFWIRNLFGYKRSTMVT